MYEVNTAQCSGCGACIEICPFNAICMIDEKAQVNTAQCRACGKCLDVCPHDAITVKCETKPIPVYDKMINTKFPQRKEMNKIPQKPLLSFVTNFLNRIIIPDDEWRQKYLPYERRSPYVQQDKKTYTIQRRGRYRARRGRGLRRRHGY